MVHFPFASFVLSLLLRETFLQIGFSARMCKFRGQALCRRGVCGSSGALNSIRTFTGLSAILVKNVGWRGSHGNWCCTPTTLRHGICKFLTQGPLRDDLIRISTRPSVKDLYQVMQGPLEEELNKISTRAHLWENSEWQCRKAKLENAFLSITISNFWWWNQPKSHINSKQPEV